MKIPSLSITVLLHNCMATVTGLILLAGVAGAQAGDGTWTSTASGSWSSSGNWSGSAIADGPGSTAFFNTLDLAADVVVTLDTARTNANLVFSDTDTNTPANWTLSGANTLTPGSGTPTITVSNLAPASSATISSIIGVAPNGLTVRGNSRLNLTGVNTFTNLTIDGGTVAQSVTQSLGANATNNVITLTNGATLIRSASVTVNQGINVKGSNTYLHVTGAGGNWNGMFTGDGTLLMNLAGIQLTVGGNNSWNSNLWANFTGTVVLTGGGNLRFDINNAATTTFGSRFATFDLGTTNNSMNERGATTGIAVHTTYIGALKGGPLTVISANGSTGTTNTLQIGDANLSTTFSGKINNSSITALIKSGSGTLTLDNTNNYTGVTMVQQGTLALSPIGTIRTTPVITLVSNATFDVSAGQFDGVSATNNWTPTATQKFTGYGTVNGSVTMATGTLAPGVGTNFGVLSITGNLTQDTGATNSFKAGSGTNDQISITGNLTLSNLVVVSVSPPAGLSVISDGTYPLFKWTGTLTGDTNNISLIYSAQPGALSLVTNLVTKTISLKVVGASVATLTWKGDGVANQWNHSSLNWSNGVTTSAFTDADNVTFNDFGSNTPDIDLVDINAPGSLAINNTNKNYVFMTSGSGKITGLTGLAKNGPGKLTIATDNDYSGGTTVNGGTLQIGNAGTTGGWTGGMTIATNGVLELNRSDDVTISSAIAGAGGLVHSGPSALILTANNSFTGKATNSGGTLQLGDGTSVNGSLAGDVYVGSTNTLRYFYSGNDAVLANTISGTGTVLYDLATGNRTYVIPTTTINTNFSGTNILNAGVRLHAADFNLGYPLGNGGVVIATAQGSQVWLDRSATNYNQAFILSGTGFAGDSPSLGAMRIFNCTVTGPVTLVGDTRIGGTINGGTISGQITGNFQLEVLGNTNSFILNLGPTNGANTYESTLVTSGAIRAMTAGGISAGPLTVDLNGEVNVFGNTVTVASLNNGVNGAGVIYNKSTTTNGTLTVGTDDSSTSFDGVFGDGASQPLGLTKVGAGTLTVSAISTNSGKVAVNGGTLALTGSASFGNASVIAASSGGIFDVSGIGGTLTLNSGQTLKGSGTVNGNVSASAGSTVNPGDTVGKLTVSGDLTLSGAVLMELNRTNSPATNDMLVASGSLAASGTLTVTNLGPALHANDTFQLFSTGLSGFASVNLQTNDVPNNVKYTWSNTIGSNGRITVLTVNSLVNQNPTNITTKVSGGILSLTWPGDHLGWRLLTNSVSLTSTNSWFQYPSTNGSADVTNVNITLDPSKTNVFFRLVYP